MQWTRCHSSSGQQHARPSPVLSHLAAVSRPRCHLLEQRHLCLPSFDRAPQHLARTPFSPVLEPNVPAKERAGPFGAFLITSFSLVSSSTPEEFFLAPCH